ncbi:MAG TPA: urease accessory protein UreD [Vicinamibacterales bacterium]
MDSTRAALRPVGWYDDRTAADVGRRARLELTFGCRGDRTVLLHSYAEPPFRIGHVLQDGSGIHLILASSAPGVFGGDALHQTVVVQSGARVRLTSQSATQVHATDDGAVARLASTYRVESGASLRCEWDPMIPFPNAQLEQRILIDLARESTLVWSDALMAGREARGERWRFSHLEHELRLLWNGTLTYMERYRIAPGAGDPARRWIGDEACYFGTGLAVGATVNRALAGDLHETLRGRVGVRGSADVLEDRLLLLRIAANDGTSFRTARVCAIDRLTT